MAESSQYLLSAELAGHSKAVRCCCIVTLDIPGDYRIITGGLDSLVLVWKPLTDSSSSVDSQPSRFECAQHIIAHDGYVYCCCAGPPKPSKEGDVQYNFFSGGKDKIARRISLSGVVMQKFEGHNGAVSSISTMQDKYLVTGSWDGTARVWDIDLTSTVYILGGHSHAVCVGVMDDLIVTGSQDKAVSVWKDGALRTKLHDAHRDIIRAFAILPNGFLTCSNDGDIKSWSKDALLISTIQAHSSFIFDIMAPKSFPDVAVSASDDCSVNVWNLTSDTLLQTIPHSASVWQVEELPNGDIVSCCEDGTTRVWTRSPARALPVEVREKQQMRVQETLNAMKAKAMEAIDIAKLPDVSKLDTVKGKRIGETKMFTEGNMAVAFNWNGSTWDRIGEVLGAESAMSGKKEYPGDQYFPPGGYDYIFDVEIGDNPERCKLPYNKGQNVHLVSETFCARYGISRANMEQIVTFLRQNAETEVASGSSKQHDNGIVSSNPKHGPTPIPMNSVPPKAGVAGKNFPLMETLSFKNVNWVSIHKKILEFNETSPADDPRILNSVERLYLNDAIQRCLQPNWLKQDFRTCEKDLIFRRLATWPSEKAFPVMDLWRGLIVHPDSACGHKGHCDGWHYCSTALSFMKQEAAGDALVLCCVRFLANMFTLSTNRNAMLRRREQILDGMAEQMASKNKQIRIAVATVNANYAMSFSEQADPDGCLQVCSMVAKMIEEEQEEEAYYRALVAAGTLCSFDATSKKLLNDLTVPEVLRKQSQQFKESLRIQECTSQLLDVLN